MHIYNTTFNIENQIVDPCLNEIKSKLIPEIYKTGLIENILLSEVFDHSKNNSSTYSLQCFFTTQTHLKQFLNFHNQIIQDWAEWHKAKVVYFQTSMQVIHQKN